ncbi:unnamed protein product [Caenorhabditis nigoni]
MPDLSRPTKKAPPTYGILGSNKKGLVNSHLHSNKLLVDIPSKVQPVDTVVRKTVGNVGLYVYGNRCCFQRFCNSAHKSPQIGHYHSDITHPNAVPNELQPKIITAWTPHHICKASDLEMLGIKSPPVLESEETKKSLRSSILKPIRGSFSDRTQRHPFTIETSSSSCD